MKNVSSSPFHISLFLHSLRLKLFARLTALFDRDKAHLFDIAYRMVLM